MKEMLLVYTIFSSSENKDIHIQNGPKRGLHMSSPSSGGVRAKGLKDTDKGMSSYLLYPQLKLT